MTNSYTPESASDEAAFVSRLKEARDYVGLKQDQVAETLGLPRSAVSEIESGRRKVSALELKALARLYERPIAWFTDDVVPEVSEEVEFLARTATALSGKDLSELQQFAEFLKMKAASSDE